ncbi:MAG: hypothetical protein WDN49_17695 [Acetobacteraceae bacterium]
MGSRSSATPSSRRSTDLIRRHNVPFLTTYICTARDGVLAIGIDNESATYDMTRYLLQLGHRDFGIIANLPDSNDRSQSRYNGIIRALSEAELGMPASHVINASHSLAQGRLGLRQLLSGNPGDHGGPSAPPTRWRSARW